MHSAENCRHLWLLRGLFLLVRLRKDNYHHSLPDRALWFHRNEKVWWFGRGSYIPIPIRWAGDSSCLLVRSVFDNMPSNSKFKTVTKDT
jgi:hypothetical protein